jgi:phage major head subunit gpT-like protein
MRRKPSPVQPRENRAAASFPDELVWSLLKAGFTATCYDGRPFFASDHRVLDALGIPQPVSNTGGGSGPAWFLLDTRRTIKPIIYQNRKAFELVRMDSPDDEKVFERREYRFGIDGRSNAGFGFWQLGFGSKQDLAGASYADARATMQSFTADYGRPRGVVPDLLVVPPTLEAAAREVLTAERTITGATNVWRGTAEMLVVPWLA